MQDVLGPLHQGVGALGLDFHQQLQLVILGALRLLVEVLAVHDGALHRLDQPLLADHDADGAPALDDNLRQLAQRVRHLRVLVRSHGERPDRVRVEAPAGAHQLELSLVLLRHAPEAMLHVGEVERVLGVRLRSVLVAPLGCLVLLWLSLLALLRPAAGDVLLPPGSSGAAILALLLAHGRPGEEPQRMLLQRVALWYQLVHGEGCAGSDGRKRSLWSSKGRPAATQYQVR